MSIIKLFLIFLPSKLKILCYRALGAKIGSNCYVGLSFILVDNLEIGDSVYIGHFNLIWRLKKLEFASGSRIMMFNWITGATTGCFRLGSNSSISMMHFLEASAGIEIGSNSVIAGRSSQFFTHGISPDNLNDKRPIIIGDWCYVGSSTCFVPGSSIANYTFVGMGSVVTKQFQSKYVLLAGVPAKIKKNLTQEAVFFKRTYLPHAHHPPSYKG